MVASVPLLVMYVLLFVFGTVLMHSVTKHRLGSRAGVAYFRRDLPDTAKRQLSDAQLRGRLLALHSSKVAWAMDALAMLGLLLAVAVAQKLTGTEVGTSGSLKFGLAVLLVALPVLLAVSFVRAGIYRRKLAATAADIKPKASKRRRR